jgi:predicted unusual protein kinase regulating ubiquinone biosynthesis (AarF/ABC1/UbiB family)
VDNVAALLRLFRLLPEEIDVAPLLDEARRQLHVEADYLAEAQALGRFGALLAEDPRFVVPTVVSELTGSDVLTMDYLDGEPIERLAGQPAGIRDAAAVALTELALREVLDWGLVQTDPNFANFLFDSGRGRIQLLDFGATRDYAADRRLALRTLLHASLAGSDDDVATAAIAVGYLGESDPAGYRAGVVRLLRMVVEPAQQPQPYRFADSDLAQRMGEVVVEMRLRHRFGRLPPTDVLFLHRKLGGLYLLLNRIGARITVRDLLRPYLDAPAPATAAAARRIA